MSIMRRTAFPICVDEPSSGTQAALETFEGLRRGPTLRRVAKTIALAALFLCVASRNARGQVPLVIDRASTDSGLQRVKREIRGALLEGVLAQRQAWQAAELREHGETPGQIDREPDMQRVAMMHCHTDGLYSTTEFLPTRRMATVQAPDGRMETRPVPDTPYPIPMMVRSRVQIIALCPNWIPIPRGGAEVTHEYRKVDLEPTRLAPFADAVIADLERARLAYPDEPFFVGQLVRVLTDNGRADEAERRIRACDVERVWCDLLRGYAAQATGKMAAADTVYRRALSTLSVAERCDLLLIQPMLSQQDSDAYGKLTCDATDKINRTLWWLATPFWEDRANVRLVEHLSRRIRNALVSQLSDDVYYNLRPEIGGDAVGMMRIRYGWPTHMAWLAKHSSGHTGYYGTRHAPPFSAPEYARNALALVPSLQATTASGLAGELDDELTAVAVGSGRRTSSPPFPQEFMINAAGQVLASRGGQTLVLRRDSTSLFVAAGPVRIVQHAEDRLRDSVRAIGQAPARSALVFSSGLDDIVVLDSSATTYGDKVQLAAEVRRPGIVAVEHRFRRAGIDGARVRYGLPTLLTTHGLPKGGCALSQPALVDVQQTRSETSSPFSLLPSLTLTSNEVGVLWESYGVRRSDTVTVAVAVFAEGTSSALGVLGKPFGRGNTGPQSISMQWTEPNGPALTRDLGQTVPTLERRLTLNLKQLKRGSYQLQLQIDTAAGCHAESEPRRFEVR